MRRALTTTAVLPVLLLALAACGSDEPDRDEAGQVTEEQEVAATALQVGDCTAVVEEGEVSDVQAIPCTEPHGAEAYFAFDLPDGDYPGDEEVATVADERCLAEFEGFVGLSFEESVLTYSFLTPTEDGWAAGDQEVLCLVEDLEGAELTGSAAGTAR